MRTTLDIDDSLLSQAKAYAARSHTSLTAVIEASLRQYLPERTKARRLTPADLPSLKPPKGKGGMQPGVDPTWSLGKFEAFLDENP